jgi:F-type H+-transporting ATPase subunit epsilon
MERKINCKVFTPEGPVYTGQIDLGIVPAYDGEMGFLYNHSPLIAELGAGEVRLRNGQDTDYLVIEGGFIEIRQNELSIFPVKAYKKVELFKEGLEKEMKRLHELDKPADFNERAKIQKEIDNLKIKLKVANR